MSSKTVLRRRREHGGDRHDWVRAGTAAWPVTYFG